MATFYPKFYFYIGGSSNLENTAPRLVERLVDFATQNVATTDTAMNFIPLPKNSVVMTAGYQTITTVLSASSTFVLGTSSGTYTFCASAAAVAAGLYGARPAISATNTNVLIAANDDLQINTIATANLTSGQIRVFALMLYPQIVPSYVDADGNTKTYTYTDRNAWVTTAPTIP